MKFLEYVEIIPNITFAKRLASAYVADYRRLEFEEIKQFLIKTANQYINFENIKKQIEDLILLC